MSEFGELSVYERVAVEAGKLVESLVIKVKAEMPGVRGAVRKVLSEMSDKITKEVLDTIRDKRKTKSS